MEYSQILARFEAVSEQPDGGFIARCPAHADGRPSLRIWFDTSRKARLNCRAGCEPSAVIEAAGLRWPELFSITGTMPTVATEPPSEATPGHTAALAAYVDRVSAAFQDSTPAQHYLMSRFGVGPELARELYLGYSDGDDTFPFISRTFRAYPRLTVPLHDFNGVPRGLQGRDITGKCDGRWVGLTNPKGHAWLKYGVFRADGSTGVTIITEGPGDGLTVVAQGYDAVVVRGAHLASSKELAEEIADGVRGTQVLIAGDSDTAGEKFVSRLAENLRRQGIKPYHLAIPMAGWDLTDWRENDPKNFPEELHMAVRKAEPVEEEKMQREGLTAITPEDATSAAEIIRELEQKLGSSDAMHAHALVTWAGGTIRRAKGLGYLVWDGKVWSRDEQRVRGMIHRMGAALVLANMTTEAHGFTMTRRIDALLKELPSVPGVSVETDEFDSRPDLLNFSNGTVDLRTGELRDFDKRDMLTFALEVAYNPLAKAPRFERLLNEVFPDHPELPAYMQRLIGYGITGHTSEQCFAVMHGKGANGKSVFLDAISAVFGAASKRTRFQTFEEKANGAIPNDIAALRDARLVMASEGKAGKPMDEATLKSVTGDDVITARFMRREFFEFSPKFLILLGTNHKPRFTGQDEGIWRRVKLIPFTRYFAPHEREDKARLDRTLQVEEAEGVAYWAVQGAMQWYANGLNDPSCIKDATAEYRETSDALSGFFPGVLDRDEDSVVLGSTAFIDYLDWCEAENLPARERWTRRAFYSAMEERGVIRRKRAQGIVLVGVRRATDGPHEAGPGVFSA